MVGNSGCKVLSKASWRNLKAIMLDNNYIGEKGCRCISKATWRELEEIRLSCDYLTQTEIKLLTGVAGLFAGEAGRK